MDELAAAAHKEVSDKAQDDLGMDDSSVDMGAVFHLLPKSIEVEIGGKNVRVLTSRRHTDLVWLHVELASLQAVHDLIVDAPVQPPSKKVRD